ncbi:MAG: acetamidase/formamidase family protein [Coriobacteriia bacterium]|nr:acetamidase/formamidase family protein [Coriobacteriia bacterium]MCL2537266.1 acetamidase/formamidase family protein [Coriobacteriia bacterium]
MNKILAKDKVIYAFEPTLEPVITVDQCEVLTIETMDCFADQITPENSDMDGFDWTRVNPATGPVYIRGVKPGDIVRIDILQIQIAGRALMATIPGAGALSKHIVDAERTFLDIVNNHAVLKTGRGELSIPVNPMVGVIGVAPANASIPTGTPDAHGGNMDCRLVTEGSSVYFTAGVEGGLFACGDLHAVMGDGEVLICGAEVAGEVTVRAKVVDSPGLPTPLVENGGLFAVLASAETVDAACELANDMMMEFLTGTVGLEVNDAGRLMTLVGNLRICQVVDPLMTVRFEIPRWVLSDLGFDHIGGQDYICS